MNHQPMKVSIHMTLFVGNGNVYVLLRSIAVRKDAIISVRYRYSAVTNGTRQLRFFVNERRMTVSFVENDLCNA
jgi:hypothetical protein